MSGEKAPSKRKVPRIKEIKKPLIIGGLIAAIAITGIIVGINLLDGRDGVDEKDVLILGVYLGPESFDPLLAPFPALETWRLFDQMFEGLFYFDYTNVDDPIIPNLATGYEWSDDGLNFTCTLRMGVRFHDGTPFNATAVKWNFDRIYRLLWEGSWWNYLIMLLPDFTTPIINRTLVLDDYTVRFVLNQPYGVFQSSLMNFCAFMVSPTSAPANRIINTTTDNKLVGTGPFILDTFSEGENITLIVNPNYWGTKPKIDEIIYKVYWGNHTGRRQDMLSGKIHFTYWDPEMLDNFTNAGIQAVKSITSLHTHLLINNERINTTMRKAISYAFNYTHFIEKIYDYPAERLKSPIPFKFLYSNWTAFDVPDYDIIEARKALKDTNWPGTELLTVNNNISSGNEWETIASGSQPLAKYNASIPYDNLYLTSTSILVAENLKQIGVKVELLNMSSDDHFDYLENGKLDLSVASYFPDFNEPNNILDPIFSNASNLNWQRTNDPKLQQLLEQGLMETEPDARKQIYYDIQQYLIEDLYPVLWLCADAEYEYWNPNIRGILSVYRDEFSFPLKDLYFI